MLTADFFAEVEADDACESERDFLPVSGVARTADAFDLAEGSNDCNMSTFPSVICSALTILVEKFSFIVALLRYLSGIRQNYKL